MSHVCTKKVFHPEYGVDRFTRGPYKGQRWAWIDEHYRNDIYFGADGSPLIGDIVWVLATDGTPGFLGKLDYVHGNPMRFGSPVCQLDMIKPGLLEELDVAVVDLITTHSLGRAVSGIILLQRTYRRLKASLGTFHGIGSWWKTYIQDHFWSSKWASTKSLEEGWFMAWQWEKDDKHDWRMVHTQRRRWLYCPNVDFPLAMAITDGPCFSNHLEARVKRLEVKDSERARLQMTVKFFNTFSAKSGRKDGDGYKLKADIKKLKQKRENRGVPPPCDT